MHDVMDKFLPYIPFLDPSNQVIFFQYVSAILYMVMPILLIYVATKLARRLLITLRRAFSRDDEDYAKKSYDIKTHD